MQRKRRTTILIEGAPELARQLAQEVLSRYPVVTIAAAHNGLVMIKMREAAKNSLFYLGELLITECKVQIAGVLGLGLVKGDERELAFHLAVIDAAYNGDLPETAAWREILLREEADIARQKEQAAFHILKTQVKFENMDAKEQTEENGSGA
jgi:alpha-D-ribose 1-methylphosphonate 5-triphosphate synthase subunit PhnG